MNSTITYSGKVRIKVKNRPQRVYTNSGSKHLFNLFAKILTRYYSTTDTINELAFDTPLYIDILSESSYTQESPFSKYDRKKSLLITPMLINSMKSEPLEDNSGAVITYNAMINRSNLEASKIESEDDAESQPYVVLVDAQIKNILAYVQLDSTDTLYDISSSETGDNYQGKLEWELTIRNCTEGGN